MNSLHRKRENDERCQGFAVIIALSLMSFILLLLLSITTLAKVETRTATINRDQLAAQQNALLGLSKALGDLQKYAGPDQRITAAADILPGVIPDKANVVGIWDADPNSPNGTYQQILKWMVSTDQANTNLATFHSSPNAANNTVELVSSRSNNTVRAVEADLLKVAGKNGAVSGQYAWWIGDDGIKAKVNIGNPQRQGAADSLKDIQNSSVSSRHAPEALAPLAIVSDPNQWARAGAYPSLPLLNNDTAYSDAITDRFHDLTTNSFTVFADVRSGQLKRDLTAGLQSGADYMETDTGLTSIFGDAWGGGSLVDPGGPLWAQLRDYFNTQVTGTSAGTLAFQEGNDSQINIAPVLTAFQLYFHAVKKSSTEVRFYVLPAVAIWNPYQHRLNAPSFYVAYNSGGLQWRVASSTANSNEDEDPTVSVTTGLPSPLVFEIPARNLAPGEVATFVPGSHVPFSGSAPVVLSASTNMGYGVYQDLALTSGSFVGDLHLQPSRGQSGSDLYLSQTVHNSIGEWEEQSFGVHIDLNFPLGSRYRQIPGSSSTGTLPSDSDPLRGPVHGSSGSVPIVGYEAGMALASPVQPMTWTGIPVERSFLAHYNVRANYSTRSVSESLTSNKQGGYGTNPLFASSAAAGSATFQNIGSSTVGHSVVGGQFSAGYFQMPRANVPIVSIGQFMHAELSRLNKSSSDNAFQSTRDGYLNNNINPSFAIGNSLAPARVESNSTFRRWDSIDSRRSGTHYDMSYLLNDTLWDRYFLSAIPRVGDRFTGGDGNTIFDEDDLNNIPGLELPSPNIRILGQPDIDDLAGTGLGGGYTSVAEHILLEGGFNINSTSIDAWSAFLSGLYQRDVRTTQGTDSNTLSVPITRTTIPIEKSRGQNESFTNSRTYQGYRTLSQGEIRSLASEIVTAIKNRVSATGRPFLSMSEFVNRSPTSTNLQHQLKGALQEAIDSTTINSELSSIPGLTVTLDNSERTKLEKFGSQDTGLVADHVNGDLLFGVTSYLTQADLLAKSGHMMTPRSDTFIIRSYGSTTDPLTGAISSEAWVEATVQRLPQPVSSADNPQQPTGSFGRQFVVLSTRWLSDADI